MGARSVTTARLRAGEPTNAVSSATVRPSRGGRRREGSTCVTLGEWSLGPERRACSLRRGRSRAGAVPISERSTCRAPLHRSWFRAPMTSSSSVSARVSVASGCRAPPFRAGATEMTWVYRSARNLHRSTRSGQPLISRSLAFLRAPLRMRGQSSAAASPRRCATYRQASCPGYPTSSRWRLDSGMRAHERAAATCIVGEATNTARSATGRRRCA